MRTKKTALTVVKAESPGLPKSLDIELAKRSKSIQELAERIRKLEFSYDDLVLFCASQMFLGDMLAKERPDFLRSKLAELRGKPAVEGKAKRVAHLRSVAQPQAKEANTKRAQDFSGSIRSHASRIAAEKPTIKTPGIVALIVQAIQMDTNRIAQAQKSGEPWTALDLKFPRKNAKGAPYSERTILDAVRKVRQED